MDAFRRLDVMALALKLISERRRFCLELQMLQRFGKSRSVQGLMYTIGILNVSADQG